MIHTGVSASLGRRCQQLWKVAWNNYCRRQKRRFGFVAFRPLPQQQPLSVSVVSSIAKNHSKFNLQSHFPFSSTAVRQNDEWDRYRQPITKELWHEFSNDVATTREWAAKSSLYQEMYHTIQKKIQQVWEDPEPIPEYGPTGQWMYQFVSRTADDDTVRVYQRFRAGDDSLDHPQPVAFLQPEEELLSMSLSPDESCVASLVQKPIQQQGALTEVRLRHIDSGKATVLSGTLMKQAFNEMSFEEELPTDSIVSLEWGPALGSSEDSKAPEQVLYVVLADEQGRPHQVGFWRIDSTSMTPMEPLIELYRSDDPAVMVDVQRTKGCRYVAVQASKKTSNEIQLCRNPLMPLICVKPRTEGVLYHLDVGKNDDIVVLLSDETVEDGNYTLLETSINSLPLQWDTVRANAKTDDGYFVEDMDLFHDFLVLYERSKRDGRQRMKIQKKGGENDEIDVAEKEIIIDARTIESGICDGKLSPTGNIHFTATSLRFQLESPIHPGSLYEYSFNKDCVTRLLSHEAVEESDLRSCSRDIVFVKSRDGTDVPLSVYCSSANTDNFVGPVVLIGYGAYGEPINLGYDPSLSALVDRGALLAFAHTRGGGDLGKGWYHTGRREHKLRSIEDFEACAMYLKSRFEARPLASKAFSAGGVLLGATINRNPGLFDKAVLTNAFVDVFATMGNPSLFLTEHEYDEFGDTDGDQGLDEIIRSYCPISNVDSETQANTKTKMLLIGSLDDPNVPYWNATVYFSKLTSAWRHRQHTSKAFLDLQMQGGHNITGPNRLHVWSLENAFLFDDTL